MDSQSLFTAILSAALISAMPLALASVGEAVGETAGLLNLGIEGVLLIGAFAGFWTALESGSLLLGLLIGTFAGTGCGLLFGVLSVVVGADQIVLGLGLTLGGAGITGFLFREFYGSRQPLLDHTMSRPFDRFANDIPIIGEAILGQPWFFYVTWFVIAAIAFVLRRTRFGLCLRAVGESPDSADASGVRVVQTQVLAATIAGSLTGLAGASLSLVELGFFQPNVTIGIGFIAIAAAMLGQLKPWRIVAIAIIFGGLRGLGSGLQIADVDVSADLLRLLPYIGVVLALVATGRQMRLPSALGQSLPPRR